MDTAKAPGDGGSPSAPRVAVWAVGWAVALAGALSTFSVPMYVSVVLLLDGMGPRDHGTTDHRTTATNPPSAG